VTADSTLATALERKPPRNGGFSPTILRLEIRRRLRNRRTVIFSFVLPVVFYLGFGLNNSYTRQRVGHGNVSAFVMISLALYGAVASTSNGGAVVSIERAAGWSRQLRVTPLAPWAYIVTKILTSLVLGAGSVGAVYVLGAIANKASMPTHLWVITALCVWIGSLLFAAFGLFFGYLLPAENVMQIMGILLTLCAFGGGLFIPISQFSSPVRRLATYTPLFGLNELVHFPLVGGPFNWTWMANILAWLVIFSAGAAWRLRRDTTRV
jgi:ABC-2 type transport system permease protein